MVPDSETDPEAPATWRALLVSSLAILAAALIGIELTRSAGNVASVWLATGVTIGLMLRWPGERVLIFCASGCMIVLANLIYGDPIPVAAGLGVANLAGTLAIICGLGATGWRAAMIEDGRGMLHFALFALLAGPVVSALVGALVIHLAYGASFAGVAELWFLSDMVGNFILAPALISGAAGRRLLENIRYFGMWMVVLAGIGAVAILSGMELFMFAVLPVMILLATRVGSVAVGLAGTFVAVGTAWMTVNGIGPIYLSVGGDLALAIHEVQIFLVLSIGIGQLVAVLMEERRRTEQSLLLYRTTIRNAPYGVLLTDSKGSFLLHNEKLLQILGMTEEAFIRNRSLGRPSYREENAAILERLANGERIRNMPFQRTTEDGQVIVAELDGVPIMDDGSFVGAAVTIRDVSEETELRRATENRKRELEAFLDASAEGVVGTDAEGYITIWNRAAEAIYGFGINEARGMHVSELPSGESRAIRNDRLRRLKRGEKFRNLQSMRISRDGTERQVEVSINPIFDQDGNFAGTAGSLRDLSEMRRAQERSVEIQRHLGDAIEAITDAIAIFDADERLVHFNEKYAHIVSAVENLRPGMSWEYIIRTNLDAGTLNLPDGATDRNAWIEDRRRNRRHEVKPFLLSLPGDVWLVGRDYAMADGGFITIRQDVSELKRREAELARSNSELEHCAFMVSHDLREPLSEIQSLVGILQADYADALPDEAKTFLSRMTRSADRMETLISDIANLSRVDAGSRRGE